MKIKISLTLLLFLSAVLMNSCQNEQLAKLKKYQEKEAQETRNIELARKLIKILDSSDYESLRMICSEDWKLYLGSSAEPINLEDFIPIHEMFYTSFPDYTHEIENIFASGDYVVAQILLSATHKNEFQGIPPTNNKIAYKGIQIYLFKDDKLEAAYVAEDNLTMMTQLGMELTLKD